MTAMSRRMGSAANRVLRLVNVRAVRTSTYEALHRQLLAAQEQVWHGEAVLAEERRRIAALEQIGTEAGQRIAALEQAGEDVRRQLGAAEGALDDSRRQAVALEQVLGEGRLREATAAQEIAKLQQALVESDYHRRRFDEHYYALKARVEASLLVPLDHAKVVQRRPQGYGFEEVMRCLERHEDTIQGFLAALLPLMYSPELEAVTDEQVNDSAPFWSNGYFSGDDARMAYAVAARYRPRTILEIGSGNSTKFFRKAIADHRLPTRLISVDPEPRAEVFHVADQVIRKSALDLPPAFFRNLAEGDVLFLDGSHLVFNGTDVVYLFLEVLPVLPRGVLVHVHDIPLPWEYDAVFSDRQYNEQYLLAMLLLYSDDWVPLGPVAYLHQRGLIRYGGVSFWLKRRSAGRALLYTI